MAKIDIAGLKIDAVTKPTLLDELRNRINRGQKTWVTTPYSEFLHAGLTDNRILDILNKADYAVPDGIGLFWAAKYLSIPLTAKSYWGKILQGLWQIKYTLAAIIFYPRWIKSVFPEKIPGTDLVWDLAKLARDNNWSVYILGGFGDTPKLAADKLKLKQNFHPQLTLSHALIEETKIVGYSNKDPGDLSVIEDIKKAAPDILLVAYGPIKQEQWISKHLPDLSAKLIVGLGGTFDYLAGKQPQPPQFLRRAGLEWLWRLFTQPWRFGRIFRATFGLINLVLLEKIYRQMPLRKNAVSIILNRQNKVLLGRRNPKPEKGDAIGENPKKFENYWQLPQGGIGEDANMVDGAKREDFEETGLKNLELIKISAFIHSYRFSLSWQRIIHKNYRFRGQIQNIIYFKYIGNDTDVKIDNSEFIDFQWISIGELENTINQERKNLTKIVVEDLKDLGKNDNLQNRITP
jgi:N-acetylglucosaminyldiphosphoundecaprenol N-acetyl-beta-D-mannosaminyltransferase